FEPSPEGLEYMLAMFSGTTGENPTQTVSCVNNPTPGMPPICTVTAPTNRPNDWDPQIYARVGWNVGKVNGYSEGDFDDGDLRLGVAVAYKLDMNGNKSSDAWAQAFEADAIVKVAGFDANGAFTWVKEPGADSRVGFHVQAGWLAVPGH